MNEIQYRFDEKQETYYLYPTREKWPRGSWDNEPDKAQWPDPATGLPCLAVRNRFGNWCGYVGVTSDHPLYCKQYGDIEDINVHGGLTFSAGCHPGGHICHVPEPGEPDDVWWLGFDCGHAGDFSPGQYALLQDLKRKQAARGEKDPFELPPFPKNMRWMLREHYRTLRYVQLECADLAAQLVEIGIGESSGDKGEKPLHKI
jgi:hypothetical protein